MTKIYIVEELPEKKDQKPWRLKSAFYKEMEKREYKLNEWLERQDKLQKNLTE
jgi:hypothetical protein